MLLDVLFISIITILIFHYLICSNFIISLILSNIFSTLIIFLYFILIDGKIYWEFFIQNLLILFFINFIFGYIFGIKINWGKILKKGKGSKLKNSEVYGGIVDFGGFDPTKK